MFGDKGIMRKSMSIMKITRNEVEAENKKEKFVKDEAGERVSG